jgi:HPt (histidine-containing phosphotransfer) domain-containing protein
MINLEFAAEEIGISTAAYKKLCALFLLTVDDDMKTLHVAENSVNREELKHKAHHIKGAAVNMEFTHLARQAEKIENSALNADYETIQTELHLLYDEYEKISMEIEVIL